MLFIISLPKLKRLCPDVDYSTPWVNFPGKSDKCKFTTIFENYCVDFIRDQKNCAINHVQNRYLESVSSNIGTSHTSEHGHEHLTFEFFQRCQDEGLR